MEEEKEDASRKEQEQEINESTRREEKECLRWILEMEPREEKS